MKKRLNEMVVFWGSEVVIRYRYPWLLGVCLCVVVGAMGLGRLTMDSTNESFLPETDTLFKKNEHFKDVFGNEEFVFILVESDDLYSSEVLQAVRDLRADLEERLPFVDEADGITNIDYMDARGEDLIVEPLVGEEIPTDVESLEAIKRKLASSKMYMDRMVTRDWRFTGIAINFERIPSRVFVSAAAGFSPIDQIDWPDNEVIMSESIYLDREEAENISNLVVVTDARKLIAPALGAILRAHENPRYRLRATGLPIGDFEGDRTTTEEGARMGLIALIAALTLMLILFRNLAGMLAPVIVMLCTVVMLFGMMGWVGIPVSMVSIIMAPLLMVISVSYSIHVINHFNFRFKTGGNRREALRYTYAQSTWPCFLTALTTGIGFGSFLIVSMKPLRDFGLACGLGVLSAYFLVMIIVPILYSFGKDGKNPAETDEDRRRKEALSAGMWPLADWMAVRRPFILVASVIVVAVSVFFLPSIPIEMDMMEMLGKKNDFVRETRYITERLGGSYSYEIMIELPEPGMAKEPGILNALDTIAGEASKWESTKTTMSVADMIKEINFVMHGRDNSYYVVPESRELVAQYLLLYEMSGGGELDTWVDTGYQKLRLSVQLDGTRSLEDQVEAIRSQTQQLIPSAEISVVGDAPTLLRLMSLVTIGQIKSVFVAFLFIGLVMILILGSVPAGLISMIPNIFPVVVVGGLMGILGINLDMITMMIAPMIVGMAVDDTVHFFIHFKQELQSTGSYREANRRTFVKIGYALLYTSVVLTLGFGIFGFSNVTAIRNFGILAATGILSALIADFCISPALLLTFKPFRLENQATAISGQLLTDN